MPDVAQEARPADRHERKTRRKIWSVTDASHCSIGGACIAVGELRRLARRVGAVNEGRYTDYEIHGRFVSQMDGEKPLSRATRNHLDSKFEGAIRVLAVNQSNN
jgi:hypothetical protein